MNRQLFTEVIGEVPPSTVDVEAVITRGRRVDRIRRLANPVVAAGVAVVLLTGAVAYTMTSGDDGGSWVGVGGQPSTSTEAPTTSPSGSAPSSKRKGPIGEPPESCSRPNLESAPQVIARLTPLVTQGFQAQRPGVRLEVNPGFPDPAGESHGPLEFYQVAGGSPADVPICQLDSYFFATATVKAPEGDGNLVISLEAGRRDGPVPHLTCEVLIEANELPYCEQVPGPNGEVIVRQTTNKSVNGVFRHEVDLYRQDGTVIHLRSDNVATDVRDDGPPTSAVPPLSHDQLVAIGTAPGMTLFP